MLGLLQTPQPPPIESILTALLNEMTIISDTVTLGLVPAAASAVAMDSLFGTS